MKTLAIASWAALALLLNSCCLQASGEPGDTGQDAGIEPDAGGPDAGPADAGQDAGADAGPRADAGPNGPLEITLSSIPTQIVDEPWFLDLTAQGGVPPYHWTVAPGDLPPGLQLGPFGHLSGTLTQAGHWFLTITVTDSVGATATKQYELTAE